jgi:hypothetical protein
VGETGDRSHSSVADALDFNPAYRMRATQIYSGKPRPSLQVQKIAWLSRLGLPLQRTAGMELHPYLR